MTDNKSKGMRRGQFAAAQEYTADGVESWRLVRVTRSSQSGRVRGYTHPGDFVEGKVYQRGMDTTRNRDRRIDGLDPKHNEVMARATQGLTQSDLTYESKRALQLDVLRMLGFQEHQLAEAGARMAAACGKGIVVAEYLHTAD